MRRTLTYECECGAVIEQKQGEPIYKLKYHWREQCSDPPDVYERIKRLEGTKTDRAD